MNVKKVWSFQYCCTQGFQFACVEGMENWKDYVKFNPEGYYELKTPDTNNVPVRLFFTEDLLRDTEITLYQQIINATKFPGAKLVVITPDAHYGYGVPVGSVLLTDAKNGAVAMGPVGYDIGCGMMSAQSLVSADEATPEKRLKFNEAVMKRVNLGAGGKSHRFSKLSTNEFENLVRGGAEYYVKKYGATFDRSRAERHRIPVDEN